MQFRKRDYTLHTEHVAHPARITAIEPDTGKYGDQLKWTITEPNGQQPVFWTGANLTPNSKFGKVIRALWGKIPDVLETDDLIGRDVGFIVEHYVNNEGETRERVTALLPRAPQPPATITQHDELVADTLAELPPEPPIEEPPVEVS